MMAAPTSILETDPDAASAAGRRAAPPASSAQRPMVLHVRVVTGHGGGPEKTILNSPRFLRTLGYDAKLAYLHPPADPGFASIQQRGKLLDADVLSVPDRGPLDLGIITKLAGICRTHRIAIWHGHDYKSNLLGLLLRPFWPMQLVTTLHGWTNITGRTPYYVKIDKWTLKHYRAAICVSDDLQAECLQLGVKQAHCYLVHNAIDTSDYRRKLSVSEAKEQLGIDRNSIVVGAVGRLSPEKGFDHLIRAVVQIRAAGHPVELQIAGDGDAQASLTQLIGELNCGAYVRLLGHVADPKLLYQALDMYVLSSIREGLPNVLLEAMALEVPVVATRIAGVPKMVSHDVDGLLVEPGSAENLVGPMTRLIEDAALRNRLAAAGRQTIEARFSFRRRMERIVAIYDEVLGRSSVENSSRGSAQ